MNDNQNVGAVQWRILIDRCPENVKKMMLQYISELKQMLDNYPTAAMSLMGDKVDHQVIVPEVLKSIAHLRLKMSELDMVLENSVNMLSGYLVHLENKNVKVESISHDSKISGDIPAMTNAPEAPIEGEESDESSEG